jgi:uncharacterized membrane protein YeaQ/YmgE (transglycosylase-associated protein family)
VVTLSDHVLLACLHCAHKRALGFRVGKWQSPVASRRVVWGGRLWQLRLSLYGWLSARGRRLAPKPNRQGYGLGLIGDIVVGIVGAAVAGWLLPWIGFVLVGGILAAIVNAVIGAVILLLVIGLLRRAA